MLLEHWAKQPPTHRLLALFLEYGKGESAPRATSSGKGFEITPSMVQAFGNPCRQSQLHPRIRKSVEEFQSTPKYVEWRKKLRQRNG